MLGFGPGVMTPVQEEAIRHILRRRFPWVPIVALSADSDDLLRHNAFSQLWLRDWAVFEDVSSPV